jgi:hypothetical protein
MSKQVFEPIMMTGCNEETVRKNGGKSYRIQFCLSDKPPREWEAGFNQQWKSRRKQNSTQRAKAYVRKNELVLVSPLNDVGFHFANLKADIDAANKQYLDQLSQKSSDQKNEKNRKREEKLIAERLAIHDALKGLIFSNP